MYGNLKLSLFTVEKLFHSLFFTKNIKVVVKNIIAILIILDFQDCSVWLLV